MPLRNVTWAADELGVSPKTVERYIARGELAVVQLGRSVRVREEDVQALILASLTKRGQVCQSRNVVELGKSASKSTARKLDNLLGLARPNRMRSSSKRKSDGTR